VKVRLEFEQKFILDHRRHAELLDELCGNVTVAKSALTVSRIRQFYDNGERYRHSDFGWGSTDHTPPSSYVRERKKSILLGTPYAANSEEEDSITADEFEKGWCKSVRRLQKTRFQVPSHYPDHRTVIDFFHTILFPERGRHVYAVVAEDEVVLEAETEHLYLHFGLPIYLEPYLLQTVDNRDAEMRLFRSTNMIDQRENIEQIERMLEQFYDKSI
jgi:hypothetical protein